MTRLEHVPQGWDQILRNMLQFNPYIRWTAKECLELQPFADLEQSGSTRSSGGNTASPDHRLNTLEQSYTKLASNLPTQKKLMFKFDMEGAYDYSDSSKKLYSKKDYIKEIIDNSNPIN